jgi:drug/metabolite transporter (DMT)-like permease
MALIGVNALWGMSFPIMKSLNEIISREISPGLAYTSWPIPVQVAASSMMIGLRFAMATLLLLALLPKLFHHSKRTEWLVGVGLGLLFCLGLILQVIGLASIPASRSGFLTSLTAVYIPLIASFVLRKPPRLNVWIGVVLALAGVLILTGVFPIRSEGNPAATMSAARVPLNVGDLLTTIGALFFSLQVLLIDWLGKSHRSAYFTPGMFLTTVVVAGLAFLCVAGSPIDSVAENPDWWQLIKHPVYLSLLAFLALFCSLMAFLGMNTYQPLVNASQASVIYSTEPLFASFWAMFLPGWIAIWSATDYQNEPMTVELAMGGILVTIANIIALWPQKLQAAEGSMQSG